MTDSLRNRLAHEQHALLKALFAEGACPPGYDPHAVALTRQSLVFKRLREVGIAWPIFDRILAPDWRHNFRSFAQTYPPPQGGPIQDGYCFLAYGNHGSFTPIAQKAMVYHELSRSCKRWAVVFRLIPKFWRLVIGLAFHKRVIIVCSLPW